MCLVQQNTSLNRTIQKQNNVKIQNAIRNEMRIFLKIHHPHSLNTKTSVILHIGTLVLPVTIMCDAILS